MTEWKTVVAGSGIQVSGMWSKHTHSFHQHSGGMIFWFFAHEFLEFPNLNVSGMLGNRGGKGPFQNFTPAFEVKLPTRQDICEISFWSSSRSNLRSVPGSKKPMNKELHWDETEKLSDTYIYIYIVLCNYWDKSYLWKNTEKLSEINSRFKLL